MNRYWIVLLWLVSSLATAQNESDAESPEGVSGGPASAAGAQGEERSAAAGEEAVAAASGGTRALSGMSILGNEEAPKSLVIVPWKSSQIGDGLGVANTMDDRALPVDKEVFMREIRYYELRSAGDE